MGIENDIKRFDEPGAPSRWSSETPLDGREMQRSLDMLLDNDIVISSAIGRNKLYKEDLNGYRSLPEDIYSLDFYKNNLGFSELIAETENGNESLGLSVPEPRLPDGSFFTNGNLTYSANGESSGMYWSSSETRWGRILNIQESRREQVQSGGSIISTFAIPSQNGSLFCPADGIVQLFGTLYIEMTDSIGDRVSDNSLLNGAKITIDGVPLINLQLAWESVLIGSSEKFRAAKRQIFSISGMLKASSLSGDTHELKLAFDQYGQDPATAVNVKVLPSTLLVTYSLGTV